MKFSRLKDCKSRKRHIKFPVRCLERVKPFLRLFKLCGVFANEITEGRLKRCSLRFYGICILWLVIYWSYVFCLTYYFLKRETIKMRETVDIVKHLVGYISLSINNITTYLSQDNFSKVREMIRARDYIFLFIVNIILSFYLILRSYKLFNLEFYVFIPLTTKYTILPYSRSFNKSYPILLVCKYNTQ